MDEEIVQNDSHSDNMDDETEDSNNNSDVPDSAGLNENSNLYVPNLAGLSSSSISEVPDSAGFNTSRNSDAPDSTGLNSSSISDVADSAGLNNSNVSDEPASSGLSNSCMDASDSAELNDSSFADIYDPTGSINPADFLAEKPVHKRKALTLKEKADIIDAYDNNPLMSKVQLARRFGLSRTTFHSIIAKRDAIAESMRKFGSYSSMRKKSRTSPFQEIEGKLLMWMEYARERKIPVNGFTLRRQAVAIARDLGVDKFTASNGWIERFKSRHNDSWKACKNVQSSSSTATKNDDRSEHIPIEPTVEIKEEPTDYHPTPSTSSASANDEFILPHEESSWTTPDSVVEPQVTLSVANLTSSNQPDTCDAEQSKKKRKSNPSKTSSPAASSSTNGYELNSVYNFGDYSDSATSKEVRKDQFDVFGEYIAAKLRNLDRKSCSFAQKAIADIIFEAEMGKYLREEYSDALPVEYNKS